MFRLFISTIDFVSVVRLLECPGHDIELSSEYPVDMSTGSAGFQPALNLEQALTTVFCAATVAMMIIY